jgi:hypothetical protein
MKRWHELVGSDKELDEIALFGKLTIQPTRKVQETPLNTIMTILTIKVGRRNQVHLGMLGAPHFCHQVG